ncbi:hypothetical protein CHS0354_013125 [Potamilus streckersoni]|uniref:Orn/DAP/Arg decarboxylase 2 C-terminal domain-containing protein n=1 Tax=Potamilus streckersoni TaxID=2493646 RepID=A0AAE0S6F9_9BIVA|nr:hypothetical protein CHS0354_013125 [Potamilus streckersoni]
MIGAMLILKGIWGGKGVFNIEQLDPAPFMEALNQYGLPWKYERFREMIAEEQARRPVKIGIRINPECSVSETPMYDPSGPFSRMGSVRKLLGNHLSEGISGLHFHNLCEQGLEPLKQTVAAVEKNFGNFLPQLKWMNFGGGHHITRKDYNVDGLIALIKDLMCRHNNIDVYLEPGEAFAWSIGVMATEVLDISENQMPLAILDTSAVAHMPDVIEMPYKPEVMGAGEAGEYPYTYKLGGQTCLTGDVIGDYSFKEPLKVGQRIAFTDMAFYTMVKNTTFNGVGLPSIAVWNRKTDELKMIKSFGYEDFKMRLS